MRKRRNKFNAVRTNGRDSKKENRRAQQLELMQMAGEITSLEEKHTFTLVEPFTDDYGRKHRAVRYTPDFIYYDILDEQWIAEDVKGGKATKTEAFSIRFKLAQRMYPDFKFITT